MLYPNYCQNYMCLVACKLEVIDLVISPLYFSRLCSNIGSHCMFHKHVFMIFCYVHKHQVAYKMKF